MNLSIDLRHKNDFILVYLASPNPLSGSWAVNSVYLGPRMEAITMYPAD